MPLILGLTLVTTIVATWGILKAASRRRDLAGAFLGLILTAATWWALCHVMETQPVATLRRDVWGGPLKYIGLLAMGPALLLHGLHYSGRGHLVTRKLCLSLVVVPAFILTILTVPSWRHLVRSYMDGSDTVVLGPLYLLVLPHLLIPAGIGLWLSAQQASRKAQTPLGKLGVRALFTGGATVTVLQVFTGAPFAWFSPSHTTIAGLIVAAIWAVVSIRNNHQIVDAEETLDKLSIPVILTDSNRVVRDANPAAVELLGRRQDLLGRQLQKLLPGHPSIAPETACDGSEARKVIRLAKNGQPQMWLAHRQSFVDAHGTPKADMVSFAHISGAVDSAKVGATPADFGVPTPRRRPQTCLDEMFAHEGIQISCRAVTGAPGENASSGTIYVSTVRLDNTIWTLTGRVRGIHTSATETHAMAIRVAIETLLKRHVPADEVCRWLNRNLPFESAHKFFVSAALIGITQTDDGPTAHVTLAGHAPVHVIRDGHLIQALGEDAPALSLASESYSTDSAPLQPGDRLIVVDSDQRTDLTESQLKVAVTEGRTRRDLQEVTDLLAKHYEDRGPSTTVAAIQYHGHQEDTRQQMPEHNRSNHP